MRIPKYRKHSSGQARVTLGGRVFYLGKYDSKESRDQYNRLVGEFIASGGVIITDEARGDLSIAEMFLAYVQWAKGNYGAKSTEFDKIRRIVQRASSDYSGTNAAAFGYVQFEVVRSSLVAEGLGRVYINESMDRLVRIFTWAASRGLIPPSVPQSLKMIERLKRGRTEAREPQPVRPVADTVVARTLPHLPQVIADMVRLQLVLGCRPGELCQIKPGMIDKQNDVWEIHLVEHKTAHHGKSRTIFVGPQGQTILTPYLLRPDDQHCFRPIDSERKRLQAKHDARTTPPSYGNRPGTNRKAKPKRKPREHYDKDSYRRAVQRACDKAFPAPEGLSDADLTQWQKDHRWSPNQLRHAFGTNVRRTEGIEAARLLLGHSDAATTTIYAEADRQKALEAARKVG